MTVCDQAVNLPLPQLDNAEEQHSGPPSTPSDPNFHPNQAAKHTRSTCQQDDPETFDSSASCAATSHAVETSCAADQDEFTHVSHGGALPQRGRDQIGSEVNVVKPLRVMDNLGLDGESGRNKDISEFKSESEDQSSKLVDNLTVNSKSAPTCEEDFITSVNTLSGYSFDVGKTPERQMKSSSGEGSGSSAHYEEPVSVDNDDNLGAEYLLALTEEPSAREPSDTRKNAGKGQHSRRARGGRRDVEKEMCLRDVEVQTVSGGTLSPSHLSLPVEAACQTAFRAEPAATVDAVHYDDIKSSAFCESDDVTIIKPPPMFCDSDRESKSPSPPAPVSNVDGDAYSSHTADVGKTKRPECLNLNVPGGTNLLAVEDKLENKRDVSQGAKSKKGNPDTSPNFAGVTNFPTTTRTDTFDFEESSDFPKNPSVPTEPPNRCNLEQHGNVEQDDSKDPALVREEDNHQDLATTASEATPKNVQLNSSGDDQSHPCMGLDEQVEPSIRQQHDCGKGHRKPPASHKEEGSSEQGHSTSVNLCNEGIAESAKDRKDHISSGPSEKGGKTSEGRKGASSKDKRSSEKGRPSKTQEHLKKSHTRRETEGVLETVSSGKQTVEKTIKTTTDNATKIEKGDKGTKAKTKKASDLNEAEKPSEDRPETSTVRKPEEKREEKSTDAAENTVTTESGAENTQRGTEKTEKGVTGVSAGTEKATENTAANVSRTTEEAQKNAAEARDRENFRFSVDEVPEMQVMVNSLTPVLQRRKAAARRSNSHSGVAGGSSSNDNTPCSEDLQKLLAAFVAHAEEEQAKEEKEKSEAVKTQTTGDSEVVIRQTPGDQKRERSAEKKTLSCKMPGESTAADPCQDGGSGLFIKPKFARTWHGPVQAGGGRAAPRMGLAMMTSDTAALTLGHAVRGGGRGGQSGIVHVHTLPVISRTLLDAMHKRYCSYQYSASNAGGMTPLPPPKPPETSLTFSLPPSLASAPLKKLPLNSEGESDTGSSAATSSTQSSPRTPHTGQDGGEACGGDGGDDADGQHSELPSPDSSPATSEKRNGHVREQEIEAVEACEWLRAAGFPQYAQMFEDGLFPVDISDVQRDHDFLDGDSIQSVIRRLNILNTCAVMKIDAQPCKKAIEESDEEDLCALSDRWEYQKTVRRWSRKGPDLTIPADSTLQSSNSHDSLLGEESGSHTDESPVLDTKMPHAPSPRVQTPPDSRTLVVFHQTPEPQGEALIAPPPGSQPANSPLSPKLRRAASERLKSALKRMESFTKKSKKYPVNRSIVEISGPVVADQESMQAKLQHLNCVEIGSRGTTPSPVPQRPSPPVAESTPTSKDSRAGSVTSDSSSLSPVSPISPASPIMEVPGRDSSHDSSHTDTSSLTEYYSAHSQLLANFQACGSSGGTPVPGTWGGRKNSDSSLKEIFLLPQDHKPGSFPRLLKNGYIDTTTAPFQASPASPQPPPSTTPLSRTPQGLRGSVGHKSTAKSAAGRISVYDNLSPAGTPQHSSSASGPRKPNDIPVTASKIPVVRSLSVSSTGSGTKAESESSDTVVGMIRSRSASATTSLELQASCACSDSASLGSEGVSSSGTGERSRKPSVVLDEFDAILQNLYRDIDNLSRAIGQGEEQKEEPLYATVKRPHRKDGPREVSFSISEQNGDVRNYSGNSTSGSLKLETQLSQSSSSEKDSLRLEPFSPMEMEDSMDHGPLSPGDDSIEGEEGEEGDMGSQTASSQDSSDELEGSADDTLERIALGTRERRDSGVGSSLTRASSERKRKKIRWESFQKSHRPSRASRELQIGGLSVCQLLPLRQLSLLKLTSIMEKCSPTNRSQWSWSVPRFMKRNKAPQFSDKNVFGVPFTVTMQRTGQPLPQCVLYAMRYLRKTSHDAIGIFRKSGVRSRIQKLRDLVESNPDSINFDELQPYDVADLLKQYFRELPECLLTNKLSDTFRSIFAHVPKEQRLEALQTAVILLPEENREVLHCLLLFLGDIAQHSDEHQMNASNLAVCFAPSLFNFLGSHGINSPRRQRKGQGQPEHRELMEQKAVHECFTFMITECKKLFMVPPSMYSRLHLNTLSNMEPVHLDEFYAKNKQPGPDYKTFGEENIQVLLKDAHDKNRGWAPATSYAPAIEVMQRKPQDGHPLRQWKCSVEIEAPPIEVLNRILHERHKWDDDMVSWDVVERLDKHSDVFHYVLNSMAPHPPRHFMVLRYWRPELAKGACALVTKSVEHSGVHAASSEYDQGVRAVELGSSYLIEPCGSGKSRLTFIARTDLRGRCPEWYNRVYGYMCANFIDRLRDSFRQEADGPETKV
ncbi:serine-rich adhesin for platelets-like isoform X2 [Littorina saxatilis]